MPLRAGIGMPAYGKFGSTESQIDAIIANLSFRSKNHRLAEI